MARIIISILLIFFSFQSHSQIAMFHAHNQATCVPDTDAASFITRASSLNSIEKDAICYLTTALKSNGLWTSLMAVYPYVGSTSTSTSQNLISSSYSMVWFGDPAFGSTGVTFDGIDDNGRTGFTPAGVNTYFGTGSSNESYGHYVNSQTFIAGSYQGGSGDASFIQGSGTAYIAALYYFSGSADLVDVTTSANLGGLYSASRTSVSSMLLSFNGVTTGTSVGSTVRTNNITGLNLHTVGAIGNLGSVTNYTAFNVRFSFYAKGLTAGQISTLYSIIQTFQTMLGRQL